MVLLLALACPWGALADCVETPAPPPAERPANGLPTLGTMLITGGGALVLFSGFAGVLGAITAVERGTQALEVAGILGVTAVLAAGLAFAGVMVGSAGFAAYVGGWWLATASPNARKRCPEPPITTE